MSMSGPRIAVAVGIAGLLLGGCGSSAKKAGVGASSSGTASPVTSGLDAWAAAKTPAQACAAVTTDFATHLGNGDPSACPKDIASTLGGLETGKLVVLKTAVNGDTATVLATIAPAVNSVTGFYMVKQGASWKLNSIGVAAPPHPGGSGAPAP